MGQYAGERASIANVAFDEPVACIMLDVRQVLEIPRVSQLIEVDHAPIGFADDHGS